MRPPKNSWPSTSAEEAGYMTDGAGRVAEKMIAYNGRDARRTNHALKVYAITKCIIESETGDAKLIRTAEIAAVLHDIGIHVCEQKYNSSAGKYQEMEGPAVARALLNDLEIEEDISERVLYLIAHHHTYKNICGLDYQALVEADFIVNLEEEKSGEKAIDAAMQNIFKTKTGIKILKSMLL